MNRKNIIKLLNLKLYTSLSICIANMVEEIEHYENKEKVLNEIKELSIVYIKGNINRALKFTNHIVIWNPAICFKKKIFNNDFDTYYSDTDIYYYDPEIRRFWDTFLCYYQRQFDKTGLVKNMTIDYSWVCVDGIMFNSPSLAFILSSFFT